LLTGLPELLRGDTLLWYRNCRATWQTWEQFCEDLKDQYLPRGYQRQLRREIQRQKQPNESFKIYATIVLTMMRRAGGYTAQEQKDQMYENSDPDFQLYARIGEVTTLSELFRRAAEYETINQRRKEYPKEVKKTPEANVATVQYDRSTCCWRCKQRGHTRLDCNRPPRKFCSRCGKNGVLPRDCHPPPGNDPRVGDKAAEPRPASE